MKKKKKYVFDIETNGLLHECDRLWIAVFIDIETKEEIIFSDAEILRLKVALLKDERVRPFSELVPFLEEVDEFIGHHIVGFDIPALRKLLGWRPRPDQRLVDTLIYSQVLNYKRFGFGHGLAKWGEFLGHKKPEHEDWTQYSNEMKTRCVEDTRINLKVFNYLISELKARKGREKLIIGIKAEHAASQFVADSILQGWPFDIVAAKQLFKRMDDELTTIKEEIEPKLKLKIKNVDQKEDYKEPAYVKNGNYASRTAKWFDIDPVKGSTEELWERPVWGDYCRVEAIHPEIGSLESVKEYLYTIGWEPQEFNFVKDKKTGRPVQSGPKMDEDSLKKLGRDGELIHRFLSVRARWSTLKTWIEEEYRPETGTLHGDCFVIGTPTFRARHNIIANLPSENAVFGPEIRSLFVCPEGYKIVGADSAGNQARALCHFLDNEDYTNGVINGDIHTMNKELLEAKIGSLGEDGRAKAKRFLYAILFGGGFGKLGLILTGRRDVAAGRKVKEGFLESIPGLRRLNSWLETWFSQTSSKGKKKPYIQGLDTRPVYTESLHKALNYLLQSTEKITCSLAIQWFQEKMEEEEIWYRPLIFMHDEIQFMVRESDAERAAEIAKTAFKEGPKALGVNIMDGDAKIGNNYAETH